LLVLLRFQLEVLDELRMDKEIQMSVSLQDERRRKYTTPARVQAWFLQKSRDNWKKKYSLVKADVRQLKNHVSDVKTSREQWRERAEQYARRLEEVEELNTALQEQLAALKKDGQPSGPTGPRQ
jgi:DNA-binding transcriptional regulator GbsR (MarR family)